MAIACSGYRVKGQGAHHTTFTAIPLVLGPSVQPTASYFDRCRRKRNEISYDMADLVTDAEVDEILDLTGKFQQKVEAWIAENHPFQAPGRP